MAKYIKPTLDTEFHIDFTWWQDDKQNLRSYLFSHICPDCEAQAQDSEGQTFDWINSETGEVFQIDLLWHIIQTHCHSNPNYINSHIPLTSAVFRSFIISNNTPLTAVEIHQHVQKQTPELILRTIGRRQIYKGIKPVS